MPGTLVSYSRNKIADVQRNRTIMENYNYVSFYPISQLCTFAHPQSHECCLTILFSHGCSLWGSSDFLLVVPGEDVVQHIPK